jgi:ADP-heptose:LPS heptosyltransferase
LLKKSQPQNILLINLKYLGDLIVCSTAIKAVKSSFPNSTLSFLVRNEYKDVLKGNPNLHEIISYDSSIKKQGRLKRFLSELNFIFFLRSKKYDAVISLQAGDRYAIWSFLSGAKIRVAPIQNNFAFLLTKKSNVWEDKMDYLNYYLNIVEDFGAKRNGIATEFRLDKKFKYWAEEILLNNKFDINTILVGIHPGASEPTKIWPFDNFQTVVSRLTDFENVKVILFLGPAEQKMKYLISGLNEKVFVVDTSENIQQLAWLINNCMLLICNDSGARHLSAALNIPTITLFPEDKILPWKFYSEDHKQFFLIGKRNTNSYKKSFLDGIEPGEVINLAKNILGLK